MEQLLAHLIGDYLLQSDWMALNKRNDTEACFWHMVFYTACFVPIWLRSDVSYWSLVAIAISHFLIDRFGVARYAVWAKNWIGPMGHIETFNEALIRLRAADRVGQLSMTSAEIRYVHKSRKFTPINLPWDQCTATGYDPARPIWLTTWLLIVADNTIHLLCNYCALRWL